MLVRLNDLHIDGTVDNVDRCETQTDDHHQLSAGGFLPDKAEESLLLKKLETAMTQLTDGQRDLIYELYGFCKSMADIAREQEVSYEAVQNRRNKIFRRLKKLIEAEND